MKKIIFIFIFSVLAIVANAQLRVSSNGRVNIGSTEISAYPLSIRGVGGIHSFYLRPSIGGGAHISLNKGGEITRQGLDIRTNLANDTTTTGITVFFKFNYV